MNSYPDEEWNVPDFDVLVVSIRKKNNDIEKNLDRIFEETFLLHSTQMKIDDTFSKK